MFALIVPMSAPPAWSMETLALRPCIVMVFAVPPETVNGVIQLPKVKMNFRSLMFSKLDGEAIDLPVRRIQVQQYPTAPKPCIYRV